MSAWIDEWLKSLNKTRSIILVGPSAGYTLRPGIFRGIGTIIAVEPDPMARLLFERRHDVKPIWIKEPLLARDLSAWSALLVQYPGAPVLFCNLIGQLFLTPEFDDGHDSALTANWFEALGKSLQGRAVASYHDRLSGPLAPSPAQIAKLAQMHRSISNAELLSDFYPKVAEKDLQQNGMSDHHTEQLAECLCKGTACTSATISYAVWPLGRQQIHLIELIALPCR